MAPRSVLLLALLQTYCFRGARSQCWPDTPCTGLEQTPFPGPWESNIFSPASRTVSPVKILDLNHNTLSQWPGPAHLKGNGSALIFDFGLEVGGVVSLVYNACGNGSLGLAFSESRNFTGYMSDESNGGFGSDGFLNPLIHPSNCGVALNYTVPLAQQRGGFRYLTLFTLNHTDSVDVNISSITLNLSFQPTWPNLRAYQGYFHSSDDLLNKIWYACTYTVQLNTVRGDSGRAYPLFNTGWSNQASLGTPIGPVIVDGAKRDRAIWAGDLGVATRSTLVGTGDRDSVKFALQVQYDNQQSSGELPMVGPPINFFSSDTYHMSTLIGTYDYVLFVGDMDFLDSIWNKYLSAMSFILAKVDSTGMIRITGANNWGRTATSDGYTTDGNMLLYGCLVTGAAMAEWKGDTALATSWASQAEILKAAVNSNNWDDSAGAYKNTASDGSIFSEDGNSMALYFNGTLSGSRANRTSDHLRSNWGAVGAVTPELPGNVVPYIESFEIKGHLVARQAQRALDLMRLSWGWYLNNPYGTGSTILEGYSTDGSFIYRDTTFSKGGSYTSHAHGWSTGPTDALMSYVVGLRPTAPGCREWVIDPQPGDLKSAQGGFLTPVGSFSAGFDLVNSSEYQIWLNTPAQSTGVVYFPALPDGREAKSYTIDGGAGSPTGEGQTSVKLSGGNYTIHVSY
ncbi:glycoside hydrolase family 78 protein [Thozetella sp. PMI_491]|nr:glycoside hydrolase family 78 protein [Thozetella sp. PMI_491]